jgi:hypothetical protein
MASYAFFFSQVTFESMRLQAADGIQQRLDHVGMADRKPFNQFKAGDELFIVGIRHQKILLPGRIVIDAAPVTRTEAVRISGRTDLWGDAKLICFATPSSIDDFRADLTVPVEIASQLELSKSDGTATNTERLRNGDPGENLFRACPELSPTSAAMLRSLLGIPLKANEHAEDAVDSNDVDDDDYRLRAIKSRRGQSKFREHLLSAYKRRCVITNCGIEDILEAAHITPHAELTDYSVSNGLLLRSDIHTLFDLYLLAVDDTYRVVVSAILKNTEYWTFNGKLLSRLPDKSMDQPNREALRERKLKLRS